MSGRYRWLTPDFEGNDNLLCRSISLPSCLWPHLYGAISELLNDWNWELHGSMTVEDAIAAFETAYYNIRGCGVIGSIVPLVVSALPDHVLPCDGSQYARVDYPLLYDAIDPTFIVDADNFTVPDFRQRVLLGDGNAGGLTGRAIGQSGGEETHVLTISEIPAHDHSYTPPQASVTSVGLEPPEATALPGAASVTGSSGGGNAHENMPPFGVVSWGIVAR